ncbi:MAG: hypothetical protein ABI402_05460 [Ferruginibacter sp.]
MLFKRRDIKLVISTIVLSGIISCKGTPPYLKINSPSKEQIFIAPEIITVSIDMSDPDLLLGKVLFVTKENAMHDTIINYRDNDNVKNANLLKTFTSEAGTRYKILVTIFGSDYTKSDSLFVSAN